MQVSNAPRQPCSAALSSILQMFFPFLLDNAALSTEQTDDRNTIEEDFGGEWWL
jgi:hypothetical protein